MINWPEIPDCGVYLKWPEEGKQWIHPDDLHIVERMIPSDRVFKRIAFDGTYYTLTYGTESFRVKPTLWTKVHEEGFAIGDKVEVLANFLANEACIASIREIRFDSKSGRIHYHLEYRQQIIPKPFHSDDLTALTQKAELRERDSKPPQPKMVEMADSDTIPFDE